MVPAVTRTYPHPSSRAASAVMKANPSRNTLPERRLRSVLHCLGHRFRTSLRIEAENSLDFAVVDLGPFATPPLAAGTAEVSPTHSVTSPCAEAQRFHPINGIRTRV